MKKTRTSRKIVALIMAMTMILGGIPSLVFAEDIMADLPAEEAIEEVGQDELYFEEPDFAYAEEEILYAEESLDFADDEGELVLEEDQDEVLFDESELYYEEEPAVLIEEEESVIEEEPEALFETEPEEEAPSDDSDLTEEDSEELDIDIVAAAAKIPGTRATLSADAVKTLPDSLGAYGCEFRPYLGTPADEKLTFNIGLEGETNGAPNQAIYAWKEGGIVYYWSPAETLYLPGSSGNLFSKPRAAAGAWWTFIDLSGFDFSEVMWMDGMFGGYAVPSSQFIAYNDDLVGVDFGNANTPGLRNIRLLFAGCHSLKSVDMHTFNTSYVGMNPDGSWNDGQMDRMFEDCWSLENLDISSFDTSHSPTLLNMFYSCKSLKSLDVSSFDTSNVTDMSGMFFCCESLTSLDVTGFDTSKVTNMFTMFSGCRNLKALDVSRLNTSNVTDMGFMFSSLQNVSKLDVSRFDTHNVTNMEYMFQGCYNLKELDVSNFNVSNVTYAQSMFAFDFALERIYSNSHWSNLNADNAPYMFSQCTSLASNRGTKPGTDGGNMARVDGYDDNMNRNNGNVGRGYFTYNGEETTEVSVTKIWDDEDDSDHLRPASLEITLYRDGRQTNNKIYLNAGNGWASAFTDLPQYSDAKNGIQYSYTVREAVVEGYNVDAAGVSRAAEAAGSVLTGFTFTNKHIPVYEFKITGQPEDIFAAVGENASLHVAAIGDGLTYQWQYKVPKGQNYVNAASAGAKTADWNFKVTKTLDGRTYRCIVTDMYGGVLISNEANLKIKPLPVITEQPDNIWVAAGQKASLHIKATGEELTYQWQYKRPTSKNFVNAGSADAKSPDWTFVAYKAWDGSLYRCVVTDKYGQSVISDEVTYSIVSAPKITEQPEDIYAAAYENITLHVAAEGENLSYQWQKKLPTSNEFVDAADQGAKSADWTFKTYKAWDGRMYRCVVTNEYGVSSISEEVVLHVTP